MFKSIVPALTVLAAATTAVIAQSETGSQIEDLRDDTIQLEEISVRVETVPLADVDLAELLADLEDEADRLRQVFTINEVRLVDLGDFTENLSPRSEVLIDRHQRELDDLRNAIQGNALLYHAMTSNGVGMPEIVGVDFTGAEDLTVYAIRSGDEYVDPIEK